MRQNIATFAQILIHLDSMCGIVGYIGDQEAYPILIKSLKRLEYRGYDSAGIALIISFFLSAGSCV